MRIKKAIISFLVVISVLASPLTAFAAHTHTWGPDLYYGYDDEMPLPWEGKCVTRHIYNYHSCLTCGYTVLWISNSYEMEHHFVNNKCTLCGLGYARRGVMN